MHLEEALKLINELSPQEVKSLSNHDIMFIVQGMNGEEVGKFFIEKNVRAFGGIDGYVDDFLKKVNIREMNIVKKTGARAILNKMLAYPGISDASKTRIREALTESAYETAPAAGGKRKTKRKTRGLKHSRVKR
jgi:hypothetical protein